MSKYVLGEAGARKLRALMAGRGVSGSVPCGGPGLAFDSDYVFPFTVQWAASVNEGEGSWIIWLPSSDALVVVDDTAYDPTEDLDAAGGDYPEGWYLLGDALDPDEGGDLYLVVDGESATFASEPSSTSGDTSIKICTASVSSTTEERRTTQYVNSAIIMGGSGGGGQSYYADEYSISRKDGTGTGSNFFQIKGFGRYTDGLGHTLGWFQPSTELEITEDDATEVSFLTRTGNSDTVDLNSIGYRTLKIKGAATSSPFKYTKTTAVDPQTHQPVTTHKLVNCKFYWQGTLQNLADFDVTAIINGGTAYLRGTQAAPTAQAPDPTWTWTVGTAEQQAPSGGKVLNYKLYDFAQGKPNIDYRDTFLALEDHTQKAQLVVAKPEAEAGITLDSSGTVPKLVITNGSDKSITLDLADISSDCNGALAIHDLTYVDENGDEQIYHGLFCDDIDLPEVVQKTISAGDGISVTVTGNTIKITNTRGSGGSGSASTSGFTGTKYVVTDVTYDETTHKLQKKVETWTYQDGLLKTVVVPTALTDITEAVEETV